MTKVKTNFQWAVKQMKLGKKVRQASWPDKEWHWLIMNNEIISGKTVTNTHWEISLNSIDGLDWEIYNPPIRFDSLRPGNKFKFLNDLDNKTVYTKCTGFIYIDDKFLAFECRNNNVVEKLPLDFQWRRGTIEAPAR